jgi:endoglucanase
MPARRRPHPRAGRTVRFAPPWVPLLWLLLLCVAVTACGHPVDRTLHPQPTLRYAPERHPFRGATLYVDHDTAAARWQAAHGAAWLDPITSRPQARWVNSAHDLAAVPKLAARARAGHALAVLVAFHIPNRGCSDFNEGAPNDAAYDDWITALIRRLGNTRAVIIMEPDAIAADCFTSGRAALLARNVSRLTDAGHAVFLDAGHPGWRASGEMADRLLAAGIQHAEGFAVNVSNRQRTDDAYRWGRELSDLVGGRDFVIDTSRNGLGPPPGDPASSWCNPQRQALGPAPTVDSGRPGLAALLWIKAPGESDGPCGGEHGYLFSPAQARNLIVGARWLPAAARRAASAAHAPTGDG